MVSRKMVPRPKRPTVARFAGRTLRPSSCTSQERQGARVGGVCHRGRFALLQPISGISVLSQPGETGGPSAPCQGRSGTSLWRMQR